MRSIKGIGPVFSHIPLADLPELDARPPVKLAALAGLAPFAADSGRKRGSGTSGACGGKCGGRRTWRRWQ